MFQVHTILLILLGMVSASGLAQEAGSCAKDPSGVYKPKNYLTLFNHIEIKKGLGGQFHLAAEARYNGTLRFPMSATLTPALALADTDKIEKANERDLQEHLIESEWASWRADGHLVLGRGSRNSCVMPVRLWLNLESWANGCRLQVRAGMPVEVSDGALRDCRFDYHFNREAFSYFSEVKSK